MYRSVLEVYMRGMRDVYKSVLEVYLSNYHSFKVNIACARLHQKWGDSGHF